ncbi:MAG: hypothetical protein HY235_21115 [Acidobacteria bacterium]|nr:hypothetical protein [Acidobacteriota bacterium]
MSLSLRSPVLTLVWLATAAFGNEAIVVNSKLLSDEELAALRSLARSYHTWVLPGRYWYDSRTGLWGYEGQPAAGSILPGLRIGGALSANASGGNTRVFVNGRELHRLEVQLISRCTVVRPGRYWLDAYGNGGYEGQPPSFNLIALCRQNAPHPAGRQGNRGWYGSVGGDGSMVGAIFSGGTGVTCGPDGGCVYSR